MDALLIGALSLVAIIVLIYAGTYVAISLSIVSFIGVWLIKGDPTIAVSMLALAVNDSIKSYDFASIPTFVLMGLIVGKTGMGREIYDVAFQLFWRVRGGLGITTVVANTAFAAVTGSSIASASVFARVSVPEMIRHQYTRRFAVGVVAGSSVLGMLIPPSVMLIIYAFVAELSVGDMFLAGIVPGLLLAGAFIATIIAMTYVTPGFVGRGALSVVQPTAETRMSAAEMMLKILPLTTLILIVLGGIYGGVFTATEAGGIGAMGALIMTILKRRLTWANLWRTLMETGHVTAAICFLLIAASLYARLIAMTGIPNVMESYFTALNVGLAGLLTVYIAIVVVLGTIMSAGEIMLILVPIAVPLLAPFGADLVWFGIVTIIAVEIGLLTPPLGIACFVIHNNLQDKRISINDIFWGATPFMLTMLVVLILVTLFPQIALVLL
jgi:tripartite ATP-independent transporter DctM subunit